MDMTQQLIKTDDPRCPVSRSTDVVSLCEIEELHFFRCAESATDFLWPAPPDSTLVGNFSDSHTRMEESIPLFASILAEFPSGGEVRYVLDVGCGDGARLQFAAERGWKCFGVEFSEHARNTAIKRRDSRMFIVETPEELVPHQFDLVVMLDMLDRVSDPYALFFRLFNRGLIGENTRLVIDTPNARSGEALVNPGAYRSNDPRPRPVHYSARSLRLLFERLLFRDTRVSGLNPLHAPPRQAFEDENLSVDEALGDYGRLLCRADGSRFFGFMQERYVPGTWSKLAEYEHLPRYQFALPFARGSRVLDFGCGTGYGARLLGEAADSVVGLDIDAPALEWARGWHRTPKLRFDLRDDLGAGLPSASFDLITCFEMIEHVDHATQIKTIENIARLLTRAGKLIISTPNPVVTANYGANPYHLREMNEDEFRALLEPRFAHVTIVRQWIRPSILIGLEAQPGRGSLVTDRLPTEQIVEEPPAFIAICSHEPIEPIDSFCSFDSSFDMVLAETELQKKLTSLRFDIYLLREAKLDADRRAVDAVEAGARADKAVKAHTDALAEQGRTIEAMRVSFTTQEATIEAMRRSFEEQSENITALRAQIAAKEGELTAQTLANESIREAFATQERSLLEMRQKFSLQAQNLEKTIADFVSQEHAVRELREILTNKETAIAHANGALAGHLAAVAEVRQAADALRAELAENKEQHARTKARNAELEHLIARRSAEKDAITRHFVALENTRSVRLARLLHGKSGSRSPILESVYLIAGGLIPGSLKAKLAPLAAMLRQRFARKGDKDAESFKPYVVKPPAEVKPSRPRVLHVIANFMTGGSSRLVVDLLEHLGGEYEQHILTSFIPDPPNYVGVNITEIRLDDKFAVRTLIANFHPHIVHVHYWGDCDEPWYRMVFEEVHGAGCKLVQNINTPVAPFRGAAADRNVFVSRYVLEHFGDAHAHNAVVYPGSDFSLFNETRRPTRAQRCIGMVYRLERDKLNEAAIEPFVEAARLMTGLKCLIVGGGSLLEPFKERVRIAGLEDSFEFPGYVSYQSLPALYKRMDVFVAPIWKESFGQVSAFAMNMGIPVIGYDIGAIPEIVADPSLVAPAGDAVALAAIAIRLVRDDAAREAIGVANQKRAGRMFSVEAMIGSYRDLYRDLMHQ